MKKSNAPKVYRLYFNIASALLLGVLGIVSCIGLWLVGMGIMGQSAPVTVFGAMLCAVLSGFWFHVLTVTLKIVTHHETGEIEFVGLVSKRRTHASEIVSIQPERTFGGCLVVALASGAKVPLYHALYDGFHEFLTWLKGVNPAVELRGC